MGFDSTHCFASRADNPDGPVYIDNGNVRMSAANGDMVCGHYAGYFTPVSQGLYSFEGNYYIIGGTCRFEKASGTGALFGDLKGESATGVQTLSLTFDGRISYRSVRHAGPLRHWMPHDRSTPINHSVITC